MSARDLRRTLRVIRLLSRAEGGARRSVVVDELRFPKDAVDELLRIGKIYAPTPALLKPIEGDS